MDDKKAIGAVVATGLFLIVAVVSVVTFQTWFNTYSSSLQNEVESQSADGLNTRVGRVIGDTLYFRNGGNENISIDKVEVEGVNCNISQNISSGMESINIENCTSNLPKSRVEVVVYTKNKIYSQKVFLESNSGSSGNNYADNAFVSLWNVSIDQGVSGFNNLKLPLQSGGTYNFTVDWGDGNTDTITTYNQAETTHTYSSGGEYRVIIEGTINGFAFNAGNYGYDNNEDGDKLIDIQQWGPVKLAGGEQFSHAENLVDFSASENPNLSGITSMKAMFARTNFNGDIGSWNTSSVTDMSNMFERASSFNQSLNDWDVSNVTDMSGMFNRVSSYNQPLNNWDVSNVVDMSAIFMLTDSFNHSLSNWDTSSATNMFRMFYGASDFNQNIGGWNTSNVTDMEGMFELASTFNQNISSWCVSQIGSKPTDFDTGAAFDGQTSLQPNWGQTC